MSSAVIRADPRDRHETLRLLLPPPRSLCAAQVTIHTAPPRSLCSPPLPGSRDQWTTSPGERTVLLRLLQNHAGLCRCRLAPHLYHSLPPAWVSQSPQSSCSFNPILCEWRTDALRRPTRRGGSKSKAETRELFEQRREREISPSSLRSSRLKLYKQLDVPASVEYLNRQQIMPNWGGGLWKQDILFFPLFHFCECVCVCFSGRICLYSFAFTICPRVVSARFFF